MTVEVPFTKFHSAARDQGGKGEAVWAGDDFTELNLVANRSGGAKTSLGLDNITFY